jgi:hypothetical protein
MGKATSKHIQEKAGTRFRADSFRDVRIALDKWCRRQDKKMGRTVTFGNYEPIAFRKHRLSSELWQSNGYSEKYLHDHE